MGPPVAWRPRGRTRTVTVPTCSAARNEQLLVALPWSMCNPRLHIPRASRRATMAEIRHRVGVNAPVEEVYRAVATADGVRQWWTRDVSGDAQVGGKLVFGFPSPDRGATV